MVTTGSKRQRKLTADNNINASNLYVVVFNSTTGKAEIWFDTNWNDTANRVQIATLDGVTATQVANLAASDFIVYSSTADPLVLDLGHPGIEFSSIGDGVSFDINADGCSTNSPGPPGDDGILAYDLDGSGKIENGSELFTPGFAGGHYADGLAALA